MRLRSLRALTFIFLAVFLVATLATAAGIYIAGLHVTDRLVDARIAEVSDMIGPPGETPDLGLIEARLVSAQRRRDTADLGFVLQRNGERIAGNVILIRPLPLGYAFVDERDQILGLTHGRALSRDLGDGLRLVVIGETEPVDHYRTARLYIFAIGFGSIILIVVGATVVFTRIVCQRIVEMRQTVDAIIDGDLTQRVPVDGSGSEFDRQAVAFNRMLARICDLMDEIRNVSNGLAHELRTPLARLRGELSLIAADAPDSPLRPRIEAAMAQADALLAMFAALLRISEIESGSRRRDFQPLDLAEVVGECIEALEPVAQEAGQVLELGATTPIRLRGDRQLLVNLVLNLIENAIRHTSAGTVIRVTLARQGASACLTVADNGPGIAPEDRERALRRFGRLDSAASEGTGLGLALAQSIARLHGGTLALGDAAPGLSVMVTLPLA